MGTVANITVGSPSLLKIGAYGGGAGAAADVGFTQGDILINSATEHHYSVVDQVVGEVKATKIKEVRATEIIVAEPTLANLALAEGYPTGAVSGGDTLDIGGNATVTVREMFITCPGPDGASRLITLHRVVITGITDYPMMKAGDTVIKIGIHLLEDTTKAANKRYYSVVDAGGDVTPPTAAFTTPGEDGSRDSASSDPLVVTFTEAGSAIDEGTLAIGNADNATIFVNDVTDNTTVLLLACTFTYNAGTKELTITPDSAWEASKKMVLMLTTGIRDTAGNHVENTYYFNFVTSA